MLLLVAAAVVTPVTAGVFVTFSTFVLRALGDDAGEAAAAVLLTVGARAAA